MYYIITRIGAVWSELERVAVGIPHSINILVSELPPGSKIGDLVTLKSARAVPRALADDQEDGTWQT